MLSFCQVCVNQRKEASKYLKGVGTLGDRLLGLLLLGLSLGLVSSGGVQGQIVDLLLDFSHG
jgi:hypothetical protein